MADKVIPNAINYADLRPECIENEVRIVRYTPTSNINSAKPNDIVKFFLQGNGFYDPMSAYIKLQITVPGATLQANELRFLDRSAHSFINRMVIRSQGVELERIEQYDVLAGIINDIIYSPEQMQAHAIEGFPNQFGQVSPATTTAGSTQLLAGIPLDPATVLSQAGMLLCNNARPLGQDMLGEVCFQNGAQFYTSAAGGGNIPITALNYDSSVAGLPTAGGPANYTALGSIYSIYGGNVVNGYQKPLFGAATAVPPLAATVSLAAATTYQFLIPIYSGIIGVLQPEKKMLPLSLMPLEVEFTLNQHALYSSNIQAAGVGPGNGSRNYQVDYFEIYAHTLFFEQEVHRALETVVAEQGLFLHYNSFTLAPVTQLGTSVGGFAQINVPHKSINSIHTVFLYSAYLTMPSLRKLFFVSHNLTQLQLRNGAFLIPSEPIIATGNSNSGTNSDGGYGRFYMEMLKGWNKMHDVLADSCISPQNYCVDTSFTVNNAGLATENLQVNTLPTLPVTTPTTAGTFLTMLAARQTPGRCQYSISLEGEELGADKMIISGKKAQLPFDINYLGSKNDQFCNSFMMTFVRSDAVLYVRPDLVVTVLGR